MSEEERICPKDGFPMRHIRGKWRCVAEYLDERIGGRAITDVVQRDDTVYYVFENGYELPLLCYCCGKPLVITAGIASEKRRMIGRRLQAMSVVPVTLEDGLEATQFSLEFTPKGILGREVKVMTSLDVAARLQRSQTHKQHTPRHHK